MCGELFILTSLCAFSVSSAVGLQKRVIHGIIIRDRLYSYSVINYYVWIGYGRTFFERLPSLQEQWEYQRLKCGGALLTWNVVQTACHCIANFVDPDRDGFRRAVWDGVTKVVMVGESQVETGMNPFPIRRYVIHPQDGRLYAWLVNDFGIVVLRNEFRPAASVTSAPVYPLADLAEMWRRFTSNLNICLLVGFGLRFRRNDAVPSVVLRHGWVSIMPHHECYDVYSSRGWDSNITAFYDSFQTSCYRPLKTKIVSLAKGDSGSPLACDGAYFGVQSGYTTYIGSPTIGKSADLIFYAYANSEEYRRDFLHEMTAYNTDSGYAHKNYTFAPPVHPDSPPPNFFVVVNNPAGHVRVPCLLIGLSRLVIMYSFQSRL